MKMTKKLAQNSLKGLKNGLSMMLAVLLLTQNAQPLQAQAQVQDVPAAATEAATEPSEPDSTLTAVVAVEEPQPAPTLQEKLLEVCGANESITDAETCAKHLLGIVMTESTADASAVGDRGYARGWFQINSHYNPDVPVTCAEDLECSATWTLERLIKKGYAKNAGWSDWAIWCHNGCGINGYYVPKVKRKAAYHWDKPIAVVTAEERRAAKSGHLAAQ